MDDPLALAERAVADGASVALDSFRQAIGVETKAHKNDPVSAADRAAQERVVETLRAENDAPIVAEEDGADETVPATGPAWVVDPIDGTANYLRGIRLWTTSVAAVEDGEPVAAATVAPAVADTYVADVNEARLNGDRIRVSDRDDAETFGVAVLGWGAHGEREAYRRLASGVIGSFGDMRRFGSMQTALAFVAAGSLDAAIATDRPNPWDSMAGVHAIRQAGGRVTNLDGTDWHHDEAGLVASNGRCHEAVLSVARGAAGVE